MLRITLNVSEVTLWKAKSLCSTLGVHSLDQLFDQMVEELEWTTFYAKPVQTVLLASRAPGETVASQDGGSNSGDESVNSTSKEN